MMTNTQGKQAEGKWEMEYDNDVGANDESFWEFYRIFTKDETIGQITGETNAKRIVHEHNNFEALREALKELYTNWEDDNGLDDIGFEKLNKKVKQALANSEDKP